MDKKIKGPNKANAPTIARNVIAISLIKRASEDALMCEYL